MTPRLLFCHTPFGKDPERIRDYASAHGYAGVEWAMDGWRVMAARDRRRQLLDRLRVAAPICSVHAPYTDLEIGHRDADFAAASLRVLMEYVAIAADLGAHHVNLHVGSFAMTEDELSWETLVGNVKSLMEYAARRGTQISIENLRHGLTSDPEWFATLLSTTGAPATFDHGHANGSAWVQSGRGSVVGALRSIPTPILATHLYFTEEHDSHFAPTSVDQMMDALDALRERGCDFWVLELHTHSALEQTRRVVDAFLASRSGTRPSR